MESFYKTEDCPACEKLVLASRSATVEDGPLRQHLAECEFCTAELEFYRRFPPKEEDVEPGTIPEPLFELADALLHKRKDELYKLARQRD